MIGILRNVLATVVGFFGRRSVVAAENLLLRQQLLVPRRSVPLRASADWTGGSSQHRLNSGRSKGRHSALSKRSDRSNRPASCSTVPGRRRPTRTARLPRLRSRRHLHQSRRRDQLRRSHLHRCLCRSRRCPRSLRPRPSHRRSPRGHRRCSRWGRVRSVRPDCAEGAPLLALARDSHSAENTDPKGKSGAHRKAHCDMRSGRR